MEEIKKTVSNAILQGEKYESELNKINDDVIEYIQSQSCHSINGIIDPMLIPDIDEILGTKPAQTGNPNFHVGEPVSATWGMNGISSLNSTSLCNGGVDSDATSIIEDNEHLRQR